MPDPLTNEQLAEIDFQLSREGTLITDYEELRTNARLLLDEVRQLRKDRTTLMGIAIKFQNALQDSSVMIPESFHTQLLAMCEVTSLKKREANHAKTTPYVADDPAYVIADEDTDETNPPDGAQGDTK
jgi:hypothetical protein